MFRRFFVPLDGSPRAEKAIPVAASLARASSGSVILARVLVPPMHEEYAANIMANETQLIQNEEQSEASTYLNEVLERYEQVLAGLHLILEVAPETKTVSATLLSLAEQEHTDLIVMCSRGESHLKRWIVGSIAQSALRQSPLPILALNEHDTVQVLDDVSHPLHLLVPLDGSPLAEAVLQPLRQFISLLPTTQPHELHLLQVVTVPPAVGRFRSGAYVTDMLQQDEQEKAEKYLASLAHSLSVNGFDKTKFVITTEVRISTDVAGTVLALARAETPQAGAAYDLIALATHGRSGLKRAFMGSVTEHIFGSTHLPLFVVCPPASEAERRAAKSKGQHPLSLEAPQGPVGLL
ncbi:MAG TPA: universal stress protein [Ktedonobacteraceae bacterium]|nr:universal stress protein [Ktedonobacteraceae bacterium]